MCKCDDTSSIFTLYDNYTSSKVHSAGHFTNWVGSSSTGVFSALHNTLNTPLHIKLCPIYRVGQRQCNVLYSHLGLGLYEFELQLEKETLPDWVKKTKREILEEWGSCN